MTGPNTSESRFHTGGRKSARIFVRQYEVAKRCKRDWMQWSEEGLDTLLQLTLTKYANPDYYREFFDEFLRRSTHENIRCSVSVTTNGGEV